MRRPTPPEIDEAFGPPPEFERRCHHPGCREEGHYRAPVARDQLSEYYWFCLEHVREYNLAWDFYAGMNEEEIELQRRADTVWQRPSWPFGQFGERAGFGPAHRVHDPHGFFYEDVGPRPARQARPMTEEQKALAVFDLNEPVTFDDVKIRYKNLVKQLHPDANGADHEAEERLKLVNLAYAALKMSFA